MRCEVLCTRYLCQVLRTLLDEPWAEGEGRRLLLGGDGISEARQTLWRSGNGTEAEAPFQGGGR